MSKSSLEAAAEAAARVNAMLIAKGKLKLPPNQIKPKIGLLATDDLDTAEVEINDAPLGARNLLTRGHTQDEICKYSGAAISTRGRFMTYEDKIQNNSGDRPLYLHIQASRKESVDLAVSRIVEMIAQYDKSLALKIPITSVSSDISKQLATITSPGMHFVQEKVFIGLENPQNFPVRKKILGPGGIYLDHIKIETGANVTLRGRGSGFIEPSSGREAFEPLFIHLTHPKPEGLRAAKVLAMNLVDTVHTEYAQWQQQQPVITIEHPLPHFTYQTILSPSPINSAPMVIPPENLRISNFAVQMVSSSAHLTPVLKAHPENSLPSMTPNQPPPPFSFQSNYTLPLIPNSSLPSLPVNNSSVFSIPPLSTTIDVNQHLPVLMAAEITSPLMKPTQDSELCVFAQPHQTVVPLHEGPHDLNHPQMTSPFDRTFRLNHAVPNSISFPPPRSYSGQIHFPNQNFHKIDEENYNKRKFIEDPNGLQDQRSTFPTPPFRAPKMPVLSNERDSSCAVETDKLKVEKVNDGAKKFKLEEPEVENSKGALSGIAAIYGSDDSDDEISTSPPVSTKKNLSPYSSFPFKTP